MGYSVLGTTAARFMGMDQGVFLHREIAQVCYRSVRGAEDTAGSVQQSLETLRKARYSERKWKNRD
jgi:hypothetical protein